MNNSVWVMKLLLLLVESAKLVDVLNIMVACPYLFLFHVSVLLAENKNMPGSYSK